MKLIVCDKNCDIISSDSHLMLFTTNSQYIVESKFILMLPGNDYITIRISAKHIHRNNLSQY